MGLKLMQGPVRFCIRWHQREMPPESFLVGMQIKAGYHPRLCGYPFGIRHKMRDNGMTIQWKCLPVQGKSDGSQDSAS